MSENKTYHVDFRIWFYTGNDKFLGKGRIQLLELIHKTGSIQNAAKEMKMSYRQAWQMTKEINERANTPLIKKHLGGKTGGGTTLTEAGKKAIQTFHEFEKKVKEFVLQESNKLDL